MIPKQVKVYHENHYLGNWPATSLDFDYILRNAKDFFPQNGDDYSKYICEFKDYIVTFKDKDEFGTFKLKLKEVNILYNNFVNLPGHELPVRIYISVVEKYKAGYKIDSESIILTKDAAYPQVDLVTKQRFPVMIGGAITELIKRLSQGTLFFNPFDYDSKDFPFNSYLSKLMPVSLVKNVELQKSPKDYLNWEYEVDAFDYIKTNKSQEQRCKTTYTVGNKVYSFDSKKPVVTSIIKSNVAASVPIRMISEHNAGQHKPVLKLESKPKLAVPSNMDIIAYD